jgi:menaquinone-dependent protoporphyrinogen oxidase
MARILVTYGTTEGHTAKIAAALQLRLRRDGHTVDVVDTAQGNPELQTYDAVIVAASVHGGRYQAGVVNWVMRHVGALNSKPTAFVSVCLGVLQHDAKVQRELKAIVDAFLQSTKWRPLETRMVAGALKYTHYNFLVRWLMKRIVRKAGGDTDTSRDYEYTDWADLDQFADSFAERICAAAAKVPA